MGFSSKPLFSTLALSGSRRWKRLGGLEAKDARRQSFGWSVGQVGVASAARTPAEPA